jgi:hypothetical protein
VEPEAAVAARQAAAVAPAGMVEAPIFAAGHDGAAQAAALVAAAEHGAGWCDI